MTGHFFIIAVLLKIIYNSLYMNKKIKDLLNINQKEYFMLEEIFEQKDVFKKLAANFFYEDLKIKAKDFPLKKWNKIVICASGSSKNAGEIAKYLIEGMTNITAGIEYASEFAHKQFALSKNDLFIAISQSGNTADTYEALLRAKEFGATTFAITNNKNSKIHKEADYKVLADAGEEKSIAATKSFTAQLFVLYVYVFALAEKVKKINIYDLKKEFLDLQNKYDEIFEQRAKIKTIAKNIKNAKSLVILSRNINSALAKEGSLKIKETCYINATSFPSGEFLHGHFAFLDKAVPVLALVNQALNKNSENYKLLINNLKEIQTKRGSNLILIKTKEDDEIENVLKYKYFIDIPRVKTIFTPMLNLVALQLLAYETAKFIHKDIDKPRNLKKCVDNE